MEMIQSSRAGLRLPYEYLGAFYVTQRRVMSRVLLLSVFVLNAAVAKLDCDEAAINQLVAEQGQGSVHSAMKVSYDHISICYSYHLATERPYCI